MEKNREQTCFIFMHEKGHPVKTKGQYHVFSSKWRAAAHNLKTNYIIKKLVFEL